MVYLGPSRLALPYFDTLGFSVPPHENPAGEAVPGVVGGGGAWPRRHARSSLAGTVPPAGPQLAVVTLPTHPPWPSQRLCHGCDFGVCAARGWHPLPSGRPLCPVALPRPGLGAGTQPAGQQCVGAGPQRAGFWMRCLQCTLGPPAARIPPTIPPTAQQHPPMRRGGGGGAGCSRCLAAWHGPGASAAAGGSV